MGRMGRGAEGEWEMRLPVTEGVSHGDRRHGIGNTVNDIIIALCGDMAAVLVLSTA